MNIKRAKQEIKDTIEAYLLKDQYGEYQISSVRQRPILLMGPPGIGKTQIMEQAARECGINLVSYTITHHTRQSAIGLPFIQEKTFQGKRRSVTEYTMSEIIASVYQKIEETGIQEGILFLDEINCVSETLAPAMLEFLQCKRFGNETIPEGWVIAAAGNPPEYNKSVREFDVVTLDRIKKIDVQEDFSVWKAYAYEVNIHPAVLSYLEIRRENFYRMESSIEGRSFATPRGWEDLSQLLWVYERLGKKMDREVVFQYIQHWKTAKDFANYLELFQKYKTDYQIEEVLFGHFETFAVEKLKRASFDEKLSVVGLLLGKLGEDFRMYQAQDVCTTQVFEVLKDWKNRISEQKTDALSLLQACIALKQQELEWKQTAKQLTKEQAHLQTHVLELLQGYQRSAEALVQEETEVIFAAVKEEFQKQVQNRSQLLEHTRGRLQHAFDFLEAVFGEGQELVVFVTELNTNPCSLAFLSENGCDSYYKYNQKLLLEDEQTEILQELERIEKEL